MMSEAKSKRGAKPTALQLDSPLNNLFKVRYGKAKWESLTLSEASVYTGFGKWRVQLNGFLYAGTDSAKIQKNISYQNIDRVLAALGLADDLAAKGWLFTLVATNKAPAPAPVVTPLEHD